MIRLSGMGCMSLLVILSAVSLTLASDQKERFDIERYLNIRSAREATFSPEADQIAFLADITGLNQLWRVRVQGGWPHQMTFFSDRVEFAKWSPKGDWILIGVDQGGNERTQLYLVSPDGAKIVPLTKNLKAIHKLGGWSHDGRWVAFASNERNVAFFDIYIKDVKTGETKLVYQHDGDNRAVAWSHDNKLLLIERTNSSMDQDLFVLDLRTNQPVHITPHKGNALYRNASWSPDSKRVYVLTDQDRDFQKPAYIEVASPRLVFLDDGSWDAESLTQSKDGRLLIWTTNVEGFSELRMRDLKEGKNRKLPKLPKGVLSDLELSLDASKLAFTFTSPAYERDVWIYDLKTERLSPVTQSSLAGIPRSSFVEPQLVRYPSFDGLQVPAYFYLPHGAEKKGTLPLILSIHGGPESQIRPSFSSTFQYFLNQGYAILTPNIRGSTGYGKKYTHLDDGRLRANAVQDVAFAVEYVKKSGYIDPKKIIVMGGSYGGYMTLTALTKLPDLWAAGIDLYGISNFFTFFQNTGPWRVKLRVSEYGDPEKDRDFLKEYSPINHVDKIKAPLLIIQGANDPRVPKSESDQIVQQIRNRNGVVEYLVFDDEGHGLTKLPNRIKAYRAITDFLTKYVNGNKTRGE